MFGGGWEETTSEATESEVGQTRHIWRRLHPLLASCPLGKTTAGTCRCLGSCNLLRGQLCHRVPHGCVRPVCLTDKFFSVLEMTRSLANQPVCQDASSSATRTDNCWVFFNFAHIPSILYLVIWGEFIEI